ncbi:MAG: hypothetical protein A3J97_10730 [Spirochaetes bacterium RIFOXYC1_FULL_54_7]|nr:MAG: hypothetical protein A3J97_10730 [Spirochaetes bacterium RIFOXYC1_FULL_54_7]
MQAQYDEMPFYNDCREMLSAIPFGFSVSEAEWKLYGSEWWMERISCRKQERFSFSPNGQIYLLDNLDSKPLDQPYKFIVHHNNPQAENPYGTAALSQCFWPWMFKKSGFRFWLTAAEKFGVPTVLALFDCSDETIARTRAAALSAALAGIQSDAAVALANVKEVDTLEIKGNLEGFKTLIECCNSEISYAITGQALATQEAQYGTRAQGEVHERVMDHVVRGDARALAYTENTTIVPWIVELNFGPDAPMPRWVYDFEEYATWEQVMGALDHEIPVSKEAIYTRYSIPKPQDEADAYVYKKPAAGPGSLMLADITTGAEGSRGQMSEGKIKSAQDSVDMAIDGLSPEALQAQMEGVLKPVLEMIKQGNSYEEIMAALAADKPRLETKELEEIMARALFVSDVWGRLNA